jgi:3-oxoacyl-[acyl-carrier-protein] synthase II
MGAITSLGLNVHSTWRALQAGTSGVDYITSFNTEPLGVRFAAEVRDFNPENYLERKESRRMDRFAQLAVVATKEAIGQASLDISKIDPYRVAVVLGSGVGGILSLAQEAQTLFERGARRVSPFLLPMMLADMASAQVSMAFGVKGININMISACSSSADALGYAWRLIRMGEMDVVIAGGSEAPLCPVCIAGFDNMKALSHRNETPKKASRPFDKDRDGFVMGEGAAVMVLESEESAQRRAIQPLAELAGYAATSDAFHVVEPAPDGQAATRAMQEAMERAHANPKDIGYINAHGTSTRLNDAIETRAIKQAFGDLAYGVPISSTKSMTGHLLGATGTLEAIVCVQAMLNGVIPPTINLDTHDPECDLDYVPNRARKATVRAALSNSFGFGGHNSSLIFKATG